MAKKKKKENPELGSAPESIAVTHQQKLQLEGVRSDIFNYFGLLKAKCQPQVLHSWWCCLARVGNLNRWSSQLRMVLRMV